MRILIFFMLFSLPFSCFSQNWADNNAVWHYSQTMYMPPFTHPYIKFSVIGDTLINEEQTKILKEEYISIAETGYSKIYMKSDSGRVYVFAPELNSFQLVYDFNAMPGDTLHVFCRVPKDPLGNDTITIVIDSLSTLDVNGKSLTVQHVRQVRSPSDKYNMNGEIIENIGWTEFMFPLHAWADPPYGGPLRCFQNDSIQLKLSELECDFTGYSKSKLVVPDKKWTYLVAGGYPDTAIYTDWRQKIGKDTVIEHVHYKKLVFAQKSERYNALVGIIREEGNGKVYFKRNLKFDEQEYLLYDFGLEVGDTVFTPNNEMTSFFALDSTGLNENGQKLFYVSISHNKTETWIEGVGAKIGLLKDELVGGALYFTCCLLNDELLYHNPNFENCYFDDSLIADAGNDIIVCTGENSGEYRLGGCPAARGGMPPYSFTWSGKFYGEQPSGEGPGWVYASAILDDTTSSNPVIKKSRYVHDEWTKYYLKVEDAEGNTQTDSVELILSYFMHSLLLFHPDTIYKGDSVQFFGNPYLYSNFLPFIEFNLKPSQGLTDSTDLYTWAKPDTSTTYYMQAINSAGCISNWIEYWHIEVIDTTTSIKNFTASKIQCYLSNGNLLINQNNFTAYHLMVTTIHGQTIHSGNYHERNLMLSNLGLKPQALYLVTVSDSKRRKTFKLLNR